MNIRRMIGNWLLPPEERTTTAPTLDDRCFGDDSGGVVTPDDALKYVAYWAAVRRISGDLAKVPLHVFKKTPRGLEKQPLHPVQSLLSMRPNPSQTAYTWKETQQYRTLSWGNGYSEITFRGDGRPAELWPIDPSRVQPIVKKDGSVEYAVRQPHGEPDRIIPADRMLHTHGLGDGIQGYSVVALFQNNLKLSLNAEKAGEELFDNMFRPGAILQHPGTLTDEAYNRLQKSVNAKAKTAGHGGVMITEEGMVFQQWTIPPNDAQFLESRTFQVQDIARMFSLPPHKLAELSRATFSNVEEQEIQYVNDCLQPWVVNWEQELEFKLFLPGERGKYKIRFNLEALLRGNLQARGEWYSKMLNNGVYNINDVLEFENKQTLGEKGEHHFVAVNLQTVEQAVLPKEVKPPTDPVAPNTEPEEDAEDDESNSEA